MRKLLMIIKGSVQGIKKIQRVLVDILPLGSGFKTKCFGSEDAKLPTAGSNLESPIQFLMNL